MRAASLGVVSPIRSFRAAAAETTVTHRDIAEWHGKQLIDRNCSRPKRPNRTYLSPSATD